jgi:putative transposase
VQYASSAYLERLTHRKIAASMSRPANPYDNAKAESFMKTLKSEEVDGKSYATLEDACLEIGAFIETVYNARRLHSALGYKPPAEFEADLARKIHPQPRKDEALSFNSTCLSQGVQSIPVPPN